MFQCDSLKDTGVTVLANEPTLLCPLLVITMTTPCVCGQGLAEVLCSKPGFIDELPICHSTRDCFWSAELKWMLEMKMTSGLL